MIHYDMIQYDIISYHINVPSTFVPSTCVSTVEGTFYLEGTGTFGMISYQGTRYRRYLEGRRYLVPLGRKVPR